VSSRVSSLLPGHYPSSRPLAFGTDLAMPSDSWLSTLSNHAIFTLPSAPDEHAESSTSSSCAKRTTMVVRGGDLIVGVGKEVRMCSLGDVKSGGRAGYKVSLVASCPSSLMRG
jgi:hypothetical protein